MTAEQEILANLRALVEQGRPGDAADQLRSISAQDPQLGKRLTVEVVVWAGRELAGSEVAPGKKCPQAEAKELLAEHDTGQP